MSQHTILSFKSEICTLSDCFFVFLCVCVLASECESCLTFDEKIQLLSKNDLKYENKGNWDASLLGHVLVQGNVSVRWQ